MHDGYYYKAETKEDIDKADKHFIEKNLKEWYNPNALAAAIGMKAKNMFSKYGVPEDGISDYNKMSQEDRDIID